MVDKNKIIVLFYEEKLKQIEIAQRLKISKSFVSKIVREDKRYQEEKNTRKNQNKKKHNKQIQNIVEEKRRIQRHKNSVDDLALKVMHNQASLELSQGRKPINNRTYRDWNPSIYKYNEKTQSYRLKKGITVGADVPKNIKWK